MADFDIEAYLEEQVSKTKESSEVKKNDKEDKEKEVTRHDRSRRDSSRDRSRRDGSRDRSRRDGSRDRSRRDNSRDRRRSSSKDRHRRSRSRSEDRKRSRGTRDEKPAVKTDPEAFLNRYQIELEKERKRLEEEAKRIEEEKQREVDDLTKDQRTLFVGQLTMKVHEGNLREFFSQIGTVKNVIMIRDKHTGKHKGFGYVEMMELESIPSCLLLNNVVPDFQKFPILVKASEAEKNFVAKKESNVKGPVADGLDPRIYIGNIHTSLDETAIRMLAEQFGPIDNMTLHRDELGNSKGYCFIRYRSAESAQMAMTGLAGMEVVGRALKVGPVLDNSSKSVSLGDASDGLPNWKLDDDDGHKGMQMSSQNRHLLMAKLAQGAGISVPTPTISVAASLPALHPNLPSRAFVISNMFDPATETELNWDQDVRDDVMDECRRFGTVENIYVEKNKPGGFVYVKFTDVAAAVKAGQSLNGRYFAGKMITVAHMDPQQFDSVVQTKR